MGDEMTGAEFHELNQNLRDLRRLISRETTGRRLTRAVEDWVGRAERALLRAVFAVEELCERRSCSAPCCDLPARDPRACRETPEERRARRLRMLGRLEREEAARDEK